MYKGNKVYWEIGTINKVLGCRTYIVKLWNGQLLLRHSDQLRNNSTESSDNYSCLTEYDVSTLKQKSVHEESCDNNSSDNESEVVHEPQSTIVSADTERPVRERKAPSRLTYDYFD